MMAAFEQLIVMEEYGGKYVSITPGHPNEISCEEYDALVAAHIMFKDMSVDPYLLSAGEQHRPRGPLVATVDWQRRLKVCCG